MGKGQQLTVVFLLGNAYIPASPWCCPHSHPRYWKKKKKNHEKKMKRLAGASPSTARATFPPSLIRNYTNKGTYSSFSFYVILQYAVFFFSFPYIAIIFCDVMHSSSFAKKREIDWFRIDTRVGDEYKPGYYVVDKRGTDEGVLGDPYKELNIKHRRLDLTFYVSPYTILFGHSFWRRYCTLNTSNWF